MGGIVTLAQARAVIGERVLRSSHSFDDARVGSVTLRPHQMEAVGRILSAIDEFGGALLCDQVGMGKTFVALALCGYDGGCVVAPAVLRDMWMSAADSAGRVIDFVSTESLSRTDRLSHRSQRLVIVDEAHHFRNPRTRRYASLAKLSANRRVLFLTATPVHNKKKDLTALLSLFLGSAAESLTESEFGKLIIRREIGLVQESGGFPRIEPPVWCDLSHDEDIPRALLDLPPPLPPRDGGDGGALVIHSLLRQWSSSCAALERALVRRLQRSFALVDALEGGTYPSRIELSAWTSADDSVQLAFAELVATASNSTDSLLPVVRRHRDAISSLLETVRRSAGADRLRANLIREIRRNHPGISVVAFSQYADTIDALFRGLSRDGGVAALTSDGARVSNGRLSRREVIERFAPVASRAKAPRTADAVTLLLTTDLLSEGVNLQDAGVVIHLDLPWTPARMEQRLGRVARMGSPHDRVFSYVIRPPASTETLIHLERVLRDKVRESSRVVDVFPSLTLAASDQTIVNTPRLSEKMRSTLEEWSQGPMPGAAMEPVIAAVIAPFNGFLALIEIGNRLRLLAGDETGVSEDPERILALMRHCSGTEVEVERRLVEERLRIANRYLDGLGVTEGTRAVANARVRRACLKRIATIVGRARPHERTRIASLASEARKSLMGRIDAEGERQLDWLHRAPLSDDVWMSEVSQIGIARQTNSSPMIMIAAILVVDGEEKPWLAK